MKKIFLSAAFAFAVLTSTEVFGQQGFGTNQPDKSAAVDIVSSKRGLLIPRIDIPNLDQAAPVNNPATSLFVYNTNTTTGVGFYYWDGAKWVRFVSTNNERDVVVQATANGNIDIPTATYDANGVKTYNVSVKGGAEGQVLVSDATGGTVWVDPNTFVADVLTAGNAIGIAADPNDPTKIEIKFNGTLSENTTIETGSYDLAITGLEEVAAADLAATDNIVIMGADGVLKVTSKAALLDAKNMTSTEGIITLNGAAAANGSVLQDVVLGIADRSIAPGKFKAESADEGKVPVVKNDGTVEWTTIPGTSAATLSTDGKIVIGNNTSTTQTLADAVLVQTQLSIKENSLTATEIATGAVTSDEILDGTIQAVDIKSEGNSKVLVTAADGTVTWIDQSALANKDSYTGVGAINIAANGTSADGVNYDVSVATAAGTTLGVVKEAATDPTVNINAAGELAVNLTNTVLAGDVTGPLNANKVEAIQGTAVSATAPTTTNNVLKYDGTAWTPAQLQGSDIVGKAITSTSLTVSADGATAALKDVTINITPGTEGQILTTVNTAAAGDPAVLATDWATVNSLVEVDNGLHKDAASNEIHLGGDLLEETSIGTDADNTLAITGLDVPAEAAEIVYAQTADGVLRKAVRSISDDLSASVVVADLDDYSDFVQEINLSADLTTADIDIALPTASVTNKGQVVNIKITSDVETDYYVNVLVGTSTLTYGSMPYQGWIIKSNGSDWVIVGRN